MALNDSRFLKVLSGEALSPPPVWFMRQAGRYLPEYRETRSQAGGFLDLCYNSALATEVTMQPIRRYDLDAAILFADILLIPQALGMDVWFEPGEGPRLGPEVDDEVVARLDPDGVDNTLAPIYETVSMIRAALPADKALIGFAGAPFTVATYMLGGGGSKDPSAHRAFAYRHPEAFDRIINALVVSTTHYLIRQVKAGANAVQIFDSWAAGLPEPFFDRYCVEPIRQIADEVKKQTGVPVIGFPRGSGPLYPKVASLPSVDAVSIDTGLPWEWARETLTPLGAVQGGLDPLLVVKGGDAMIDAARALKKTFEGMPYIFNLGHGFVPETPPEHVADLMAVIREG